MLSGWDGWGVRLGSLVVRTGGWVMFVNLRGWYGLGWVMFVNLMGRLGGGR